MDLDSNLETAYILHGSQYSLHFNQQCAKVTNLVFCCITSVLFPEDSLLWLETFRRTFSVILWYKYVKKNFVHFVRLVLWVCYQQCTEWTRESWFCLHQHDKMTVIIIQTHHCYQQHGKFYQNSSVKINSISREKYSGLSIGKNRKISDHMFCFWKVLKHNRNTL